MKKEIIELLENGNGILKLNEDFRLHRWQKDALGNKVDKLELKSDLLHYCSSTTEIKSRNYEGILEEVKKAIEKDYDLAKEEVIKNISNGYIQNNKVQKIGD